MLIFPALLVVYIVVVHILIQTTAANEPQANAKYMIILGAKVNGERMSNAYYNRAQMALAYLQENPETTVIATGGQGKGEHITEAEAMRRYLVENGIAEDRIIKEEQSTSTFENLKFAKAFIEQEKPEVLIVSNDFHLFRASIIAKRLHMQPDTLAAPTPQIAVLKLYAREYMAIAKTLLVDW
ncbi:hypothetical protein BFG57_15380 [Bacillus solimangrovi]|uniref:DUF218 domain-containing protein n=1 Tax=Bacillus solimangrovi TaxID=1305675 RepID=A0A1E5LEP4_9BACI|nr:hypothetical protein BFG57_15380 [Bacillus solimangrovi]